MARTQGRVEQRPEGLTVRFDSSARLNFGVSFELGDRIDQRGSCLAIHDNRRNATLRRKVEQHLDVTDIRLQVRRILSDGSPNLQMSRDVRTHLVPPMNLRANPIRLV